MLGWEIGPLGWMNVSVHFLQVSFDLVTEDHIVEWGVSSIEVKGIGDSMNVV